MRYIDFSEDSSRGAYKTGPKEEMPTIRTPELSGRDLINLREKADKDIREKWGAPLYYCNKGQEAESAMGDIEHSIGIASSPKKS